MTGSPEKIFSIKIYPSGGSTGDNSYKSITDLTWSNIPQLAILTGRNGSGKTQLLELLSLHFSGARPVNRRGAMVDLGVTVSTEGGINYEPDEIAYVPSEGRFSGGGSSISALANLPEQVIANSGQVSSPHSDPNAKSKFHRNNRYVSQLSRGMTTREMLVALLSDDFLYALDDIDVTAGISHVFLDYRLKASEAFEAGRPGLDKNQKDLGPAPWDVVNESLKAAGFPYEVVSPLGTRIISDYQLTLKDIHSGNQIPAVDLSSGEKVIMQLVLWLFAANKDGIFPKLLLLDEPDAHLHPAMTTEFLNVISEVLVKKYGVRVILTTHSPSTVALAPDNSVFQIERGGSEIIPITSRADIISILTAGLVTVSKSTKFCFVEDEADVDFYSAVRDILSDFGPSCDDMALRPSPSIAFLPASIGKSSEKIAGGSSVVAKWVNKLNAEPLDRMFLGIIDRDVGNQPAPRIFTLQRHSIENYLLDPLVIFSLLVEEHAAPPLSRAVSITAGDEHLIRSEPKAVLQEIADAICARLESAGPALVSGNHQTITYTNGHGIQVPDWVVDFRGHDLLPIAQKAFGQKIITRPRLLKALRRCRMLASDLATLLADIQDA